MFAAALLPFAAVLFCQIDAHPAELDIAGQGIADELAMLDAIIAEQGRYDQEASINSVKARDLGTVASRLHSALVQYLDTHDAPANQVDTAYSNLKEHLKSKFGIRKLTENVASRMVNGSTNVKGLSARMVREVGSLLLVYFAREQHRAAPPAPSVDRHSEMLASVARRIDFDGSF